MSAHEPLVHGRDIATSLRGGGNLYIHSYYQLSWRPELHWWPTVYETVALLTELRQHAFCTNRQHLPLPILTFPENIKYSSEEKILLRQNTFVFGFAGFMLRFLRFTEKRALKSEAMRSSNTKVLERSMVPRPRIELGTQGFSGLRSTN